MLSRQTIRELRSELELLRRRAAAIEALLGEDSAPENEAQGVVAQILKQREMPRNKATFAGQVREALRAIGGSATSRDVARWLEQRGVRSRNDKPLRSAVSVELFRMAKKQTGGVQKVSRGRYRIEGR